MNKEPMALYFSPSCINHYNMINIIDNIIIYKGEIMEQNTDRMWWTIGAVVLGAF